MLTKLTLEIVDFIHVIDLKEIKIQIKLNLTCLINISLSRLTVVKC